MLKMISMRSRAELCMLLVACIWGINFVIVKNALADIGPYLFLGLRFILAFLVLAALSFKDVIKIRLATLGAGTILGLFLFIGYVFQTLGLKYTSCSNTAFITGVSVVLVPIIYSILHKQKPSFITAITVIVAAAGIFMFSDPAGSFSLTYGDLLVLICAFGFAFHIIYVDRYSHRHNALAITGVQLLLVGLLCITIAFLIEPIPVRLTFNAVFAIFITAVFATAMAFLLQNYLQQYSTPTRFAIVLTSEPIFAALAGYWWAQEHLERNGLIGAALILLAMLLSIVFRKSI
ncbi:MAG: DMT family transporter [Syntrophomonas sp.]|nr:DMT family transporter [Syntrophomonas sp.]